MNAILQERPRCWAGAAALGPRRRHDPQTETYPSLTGAARRRIVATAFAALAAAGHPMPPEAVGDALADGYNALHDEELSLFPDAY